MDDGEGKGQARTDGDGRGGGRRAAPGAALLRLLVLAIVIGAVAGLLGVAFRVAVDRVQAWATGSNGTILEAARALPWWRRLLMPAAGALVGGLLFHVAARRETAFGIADLMEVVSFRRRQIRFAPTIGRIASALATLASGGSVGREGPVIQLGATAANLVGRATRADPRSHSILLAAGAAAGIAAAYNAPLAGALFVMEVVLCNFAMDVFASVALAAAAGTLVMRAFLPDHPLYDVPAAVASGSLASIVAALPLGIACGVGAVAFQRLLQRTTAFFADLPLHPIVKPALGGLLVGVIGIKWPEVFGNGFNAVGELLSGKLASVAPAQLLGASALLLLFMKPLATAFSVGSGGQGGVFTPSMVVGAALGALFAAVLLRVPGLDTTRQTLVIVGMAGVIAGITHAPITAAALLFEMTDRPALLLPLAVGAAASALTAKFLARDSLYSERLRARGVPVDAGIEELTLRQTQVGDLLDREVPLIAAQTSLQEIVDRFARERFEVLYVVDGQRILQGAVTLQDVKEFLNKSAGATGQAVIALDVMRKPAALDPKSSLADVLDRFDEPEFDELPVVDSAGALLGRVTRRDLLATLNLEVLGRPSLRAKFVIEGDHHPRYLELPRGFEIARLPVTPALAGKRLGDTGLRRNHQLVVLAIVRPDPEIGEQRIAFDPDFILSEGEQVVVMGRRDDVATARQSTAGAGTPS